MNELLQLTSSKISHPGRKRENNEDFVASFEPAEMDVLQTQGSMYIVADGVGGASRGEKASQFAAQKVLHLYYSPQSGEPGEKIASAIRQASREIYQFSQSEEIGAQMATTMTVALVLNNQLIVANVGDSRTYLIHNGQIKIITRDHSYTGELMEDGTITEAESLTTKGKNKLTRSVGGDSDVKVDVFPPIQLETGDRIILCSDGLTRYALKEDILRLALTGKPDVASGILVDFANNNGGADNVTVVVVDVGQPLSNASNTVLAGAGQRLPTAVDWDTMDTDHGIYARKYGKRKKKRFTPLMIILSLFVILLGLAIVVVSTDLLSKVAAVEILPTSTIAVKQSPTAVTLLLVTLEPTPTFTPTPEPSATPEPTLNPSLHDCMYPYGKQPLLSGALEVFNIAYDPGGIYFYRLMKDDRTFGDPVEIKNHDLANVPPVKHFYYVIPNILPNICSEKGGILWPPIYGTTLVIETPTLTITESITPIPITPKPREVGDSQSF
jgi:PPM family protein phosphatase